MWIRQSLLTFCCAALCGVLQTANGFEPFAAGDRVLPGIPEGNAVAIFPGCYAAGNVDSGPCLHRASNLRAFELPELTVSFDPFWGDWVARRSQMQERRMAAAVAVVFDMDEAAAGGLPRPCFADRYFDVQRTCGGDACVRDVEYLQKFRGRRTNADERSILARSYSARDWFFSSRGMDDSLVDGFIKSPSEANAFHEVMKPARWRVQPPDMIGFSFVFGKVGNEMLETSSRGQTPEVAAMEPDGEKVFEWNGRVRMRDVTFYMEPDLPNIIFNPSGINRFSNAFLIGCQTGINF